MSKGSVTKGLRQRDDGDSPPCHVFARKRDSGDCPLSHAGPSSRWRVVTLALSHAFLRRSNRADPHSLMILILFQLDNSVSASVFFMISLI